MTKEYARLVRVTAENLSILAESGGWDGKEDMLEDLGVGADILEGVFTVMDEKIASDAKEVKFIEGLPRCTVVVMEIIHGRCFLETRDVHKVLGSMYAWIDFQLVG